MYYSAGAQRPNKKLVEIYRMHCSLSIEVFKTLMALEAQTEKSPFSDSMGLCPNFQAAASPVQVTLPCLLLNFFLTKT